MLKCGFYSNLGSQVNYLGNFHEIKGNLIYLKYYILIVADIINGKG